MYPEWLVSGLSFPREGIEAQLLAAKALVPAKLLAGSGLAEDLSECFNDGYHHFAMNTLQDIGIWAEANGLDGELPQEFWVRIAAAAHSMEFPQFVPYCLGKAQRLPRQDPGDLMAAFATLPRIDGVTGDLRSLSDRAAETLRRGDPATTGMIENGDLAALADRLRNGTYDRLGEELSESFSEAFDDLFALAAGEGFPAEHAKHAWAVIGPNQFRVVLGGGLFALTSADVWWRAT
ncbi:MAG: hypothetical protein ACRDOO_02055 [Actinomadura sp.]